jgi:type I restriction enzyme, R subunit
MNTTNFIFLINEWPKFYDRAVKAEKLAITDPRTSLTYARMALELAINWMYKNDSELELPYDTSLSSLMKTLEFKNQFGNKFYNEIDLIRKVGNLAIHNKPVSVTDSENIISHLYYFAKWFAKSYSTEEIEIPGLFDSTLIPKVGEAALTKRQLAAVQDKFDKDLIKFQEELKKTLERNKELEEENELYRKQVEALQAQIETQKLEATREDEVHHPRNEVETRKYLIDVLLREAGWDLKGVNDKEYKVDYMPKSTNKSEIGWVDYVLWGDDGQPLALVEAKRTLTNVKKGENQAQLYADCLEKMHGQRPVMFYSNGFETYIWDDRFYKKSRPVHGFYSKKELETIIFRRTNRKDIRTHSIDTNIVDRTYQMRAIKSIAEHIAGTDKKTGNLIGTNRGALLVLATGTGKTRIAIAFSKMMLEANWAKRVLFLADRISLVRQAKRNFVKFLPEHSCVNLLEDRENSDTRFVFSTYQTMMGLIDDMKNGNERFYGIGHFDLVIIDEAHRSIYRKYQAIFEYFDAPFLGLTATPKDSIDKNTYAVFGLADKSPTDAYSFDEAVANNHLKPYHSIEVPTKFQTKGIHYNELSPEEQEEFEKEILDGEEATGDEWVDSKALNEWLFNKDTAIKILNYILKQGIKKRGGEEPGKTIIFAANRKHAQFLKDMFIEIDKELFGNEYAKVITHGEPKAEDFIQRFCDEEKERLPQIAISVDMLDTGIDAPSVVNLVFYKRVRSYTKFWQMIGRGSRPRPDLFGPGKDKEQFYIFDLCGNFEFFKENPRGIETGTQKSLSEIVYGLKLQLAQYLKNENFKDDDELQSFRKQLLDELHKGISSLDKERFEVRMKLKHVLDYGEGNRELWNHLDNEDIRTIEDNLANLVKPEKGESDLSRFYDKLLYTLMIKRIETPQVEDFIKRFMVPITKVAMVSKKLLKKTSIPEVTQNLDLIKQPLERDFWKVDGLAHLEKIRAGIRELMKYIDPTDQKYVTTNFEDELNETEVVHGDYADNIQDAYNSPFAGNIHRLEEIIRENQNNITISRIRNGQSITEAELESLETILLNGKLKKDELENELGKKLDLVDIVINLTGLSENHVNSAFAYFINQHELNSKQIQFLDTIKLFFTKNGKIDPAKFYESPFKNFHSLGIEGVFNKKQTDRIFEIIEKLNRRGIGA